VRELHQPPQVEVAQPDSPADNIENEMGTKLAGLVTNQLEIVGRALETVNSELAIGRADAHLAVPLERRVSCTGIPNDKLQSLGRVLDPVALIIALISEWVGGIIDTAPAKQYCNVAKKKVAARSVK